MMKTKILFSDLDGTLLDDKKNVSRRDLESINEMIEKGHRFAIATGRPIYSAKVVAKNLGLYRDGIFLIASNGGVVFDCGSSSILSAETLDMDTVRDLFIAAGTEGLSIHTYTDDYVVSVRNTREIDLYCKNILMPHRLLERIPEDLPARPPKLIVMSIKEGSRAILEDFEKRHAALVSGRAQSVFSNDFLLEYLPIGVSKGNAIEKLCALLGIPVEDAVAAGDEANDIPMLKAVGCAVVMANGTDETKAFADHVTKHTNNESGISEVIQRFILQ
ncbi:MAG: HAD family hydrolase [Lachnospiraceae bacterium]|nr:HAD family hydrolase [Lachnospiraceae bacterium]